jgi:hypothetical protein
MSKKRPPDPNQTSIFDFIAISDGTACPKTVSHTSRPSVERPRNASAEHPVFLPSLWLGSTVFATIFGAFELIPQPEQPSLSYTVGIVLIGIAASIAFVALFMLIPWSHGRHAVVKCTVKRRAHGLQTLFFLIPISLAVFLGNAGRELASDDIYRAVAQARDRLDLETRQKEWEKKTEVKPASNDKPSVQ